MSRKKDAVQCARFRRRCLLFACAITSAAAHAQVQTSDQSPPSENAPAKEDAVTLDEVIVTGVQEGQTTEGTGSYTTHSTGAAIGLPLKLREIPQSITVITDQHMQDQNLTNLDSALQITPGVTRNFMDSERINYSARGFSIDNIQYDGVTSSLDNGIGFIDTALYDRVEVVRGATGLLTGSGNPSASINLIRKRPTLYRSFGASVAAGSWDNYRGTLDFSTLLTKDGRIRGRIIGVHQDQKSYMDFYQQKKNIGYGVIEVDLTNSTILTAGYEYQDNKPKGSTWAAAPLFYSDGALTKNLRRSATLSPPWTYYQVKSKTAFLNLSHEFNNGWKFKSAFTNSRLDQNAELFTVGGMDPATGRTFGYYPDRQTGNPGFPVIGSGVIFGSERRQNTLDLQMTGPFSLMGRQHELVLGTTMSETKVDTPGARLLSITPTPAPGLDEIGEIPRLDFSKALPWGNTTNVKTKSYGLYTAARFSLSDEMRLILGGRFNRYDLDKKEVGAGVDYRKNKFTSYAGLTYDLNKNLTAFASVLS